MSQNSRHFSQTQRAALYVKADGHCTICGVELEPGWHADHIEPFSAGGATSLANGQATCPRCNMSKGAKHMELRTWQKNALTEFEQDRDKDFLAVAFPGTGKTTFGLCALQAMKDFNNGCRVTVVVPNVHLRKQWAVSAEKHGIHLDHEFEVGQGALARDYDGIVVTYSAVAHKNENGANSTLFKHIMRAGGLVILDEIHHAGESENLAWGIAIKEAFDGQHIRRLLLSGTPFRTDGKRIPFVNYDHDGKAIPNFEYNYGQAMRDGVVRGIEFAAMDGEMFWQWDNEDRNTVTLGNATEQDISEALAAALNPYGDWIPSVLQQAHDRLEAERLEIPNAGGLVLANDADSAWAYKAQLDKITGQSSEIVLHTIDDASQKIEEFARSSHKWIVAVKMISEGVDIPRLMVGVYATSTRTELFFRQVVGRFVRRVSSDENALAALFIPSVQPLLGYAAEIENAVDAVLANEPGPQEPDGTGDRFDYGRTLHTDSGEAVLSVVVNAGEHYSEAELAYARQQKQGIMQLLSTPDSAIAQLLRNANGGLKQSTNLATKIPNVKPMTKSMQKKRLRKDINRDVNQLAKLSNREHRDIHKLLNRRCNEAGINEATIETLEQRLEYLDHEIRRYETWP